MNPINTGEQKDVHEFFNLFVDRMEISLKPTPFKDLFKDIYSYTIKRIKLCSNCDMRSFNLQDELEYNISLEVRNYNTLKDSLDAFFQKEIVIFIKKIFNCR